MLSSDLQECLHAQGMDSSQFDANQDGEIDSDELIAAVEACEGDDGVVGFDPIGAEDKELIDLDLPAMAPGDSGESDQRTDDDVEGDGSVDSESDEDTDAPEMVNELTDSRTENLIVNTLRVSCAPSEYMAASRRGRWMAAFLGCAIRDSE